MTSLRSGFCNRYTLDTENLKILNLGNPEYSIFHWLAVIIQNRSLVTETGLTREGKKYLIDNFSVDTSSYDIIIGRTADELNQDNVDWFLKNTFSIEYATYGITNNTLGDQIVVKSERAFSQLHYEGYSLACKEEFYLKKKARIDKERKAFWNKALEKNAFPQEKHMSDILRLRDAAK